MRIVVHGQEAFGKAVLERLLAARRERRRGVFRARQRVGKARATRWLRSPKRRGLPLHQPKSWKTPEALELMTSRSSPTCA